MVLASGFNKETSDRRKLSWETLCRGEKDRSEPTKRGERWWQDLPFLAAVASDTIVRRWNSWKHWATHQNGQVWPFLAMESFVPFVFQSTTLKLYTHPPHESVLVSLVQAQTSSAFPPLSPGSSHAALALTGGNYWPPPTLATTPSLLCNDPDITASCIYLQRRESQSKSLSCWCWVSDSMWWWRLVCTHLIGRSQGAVWISQPPLHISDQQWSPALIPYLKMACLRRPLPLPLEEAAWWNGWTLIMMAAPMFLMKMKTTTFFCGAWRKMGLLPHQNGGGWVSVHKKWCSPALWSGWSETGS